MSFISLETLEDFNQYTQSFKDIWFIVFLEMKYTCFFSPFYLYTEGLSYCIAGRKGKLGCELLWYLKFHNHVIQFVSSKFWMHSTKS